MSRNGREYALGGRTTPVGSLSHRRGQSLTGIISSSRATVTDENLDLFSKNRRSISVASSSDDSSDGHASSLKLGRLSVGSVKPIRSGADDLLSSTDGGKHDYDWLLTPPGTPLFPSSAGIESLSTLPAPKTKSLVRSTSTTKASRLSVSQSESNHVSRPVRSSSVTRSSVSSSQFSAYSSSRSSSILNTSSASVSSYIRPSSPMTRSSSAARPSTPSTRQATSRPSTPSRVRPVTATSSTDKPRAVQNSRPSTPSSRPQISSNISSPASRSNSRPSTPTRRNSAPSLSTSSSTSLSTSRVSSNGRISAPSSRPSSPSPRVRAPQQPIVPPDFPLETPPNLRTTLPDRPLSAGRSRPGSSLTVNRNAETPNSSNSRRQPSPVVTRGRLPAGETTGRSRAHSATPDALEQRKSSHSPDLGMRKPIKTVASATERNGFGRTISKNSLDMAIRHMDIRSSTASMRALSGTTLFPQSIRSANSKTQSIRVSSAPASVNGNGRLQNGNDPSIAENGNGIKYMNDGSEAGQGRYLARLTEVDIYESSRYDAMLLKEDLKNTNWLHSIDNKSDQGSLFDSGFEPLPEPFGPL